MTRLTRLLKILFEEASISSEDDFLRFLGEVYSNVGADLKGFEIDRRMSVLTSNKLKELGTKKTREEK